MEMGMEHVIMDISDPYGCAHCGLVERQHYMRWHEGRGWENWQQPSQSLILVRMRTRRMRGEQ